MIQILKFCNENKIKPILVTTPVTYAYNELVTKDIYGERIYKHIDDVLSKIDFPVQYLDYFFDADHLTPTGAEKFTNILLKDIKLGEIKMIDLHSHVLYGVDDGPKSLEESLELLKLAVNMGYTHICCTSHYQKGKYENKKYFENFSNLKQEIENLNIPINLYCGNELFLDIDTLMTLSKKEFFPLNNTKYILIEFPKGVILNVKLNILKTLIGWGYKPIVAHVERYEELLQNFKELKELNVKTQFNLSSLEYLKENYSSLIGEMDIVATDVHDLKGRSYNLEDKIKNLKEIVGEEKFKDLTINNPQKILEDVENEI